MDSGKGPLVNVRDPVSGNGSGQTARSLVGYVHKLQCSDISSSVYSAFKQSNYKPYNFF